MVLSQWEPTPFVLLVFVLILTSVMPMVTITMVVKQLLARPTVKLTEAARPVPALLTVVSSMEVIFLNNLPVCPMVPADLALRMLIALSPPLTVALMVVAILVEPNLLVRNVDLVLMEEKSPVNPTAILRPTFA